VRPLRKVHSHPVKFLAVGVSQPPCFEHPLDFDLIATVHLRNDTPLNELVSIFGYAQKRGMKDRWVQMLKSRIDRYRNPPIKVRNPLLPLLRGAFSRMASRLHELVAKLRSRFR
jgi:hypothetical protein